MTGRKSMSSFAAGVCVRAFVTFTSAPAWSKSRNIVRSFFVAAMKKHRILLCSLSASGSQLSLTWKHAESLV